MKRTRIVGLDWGQARIGVALSDESKLIATPMVTLKAEKRSKETAQKVLSALLEHAKGGKYEVEKIVVGMPLMMSGKSGFLADEVSHFIQELKALTDIPVISWDERLTTSMAERSLKESSLTRKRRAGVVDSIAAIIILQNYLDFSRLSS